MNITLNNPIVRAWLILIALTLVTWIIGLEHGFGGQNGVVIGMGTLLAIAFLKVHLIGRNFMELKTAPAWLKFAFSAWVGGVGALLIVLYVWGSKLAS